MTDGINEGITKGTKVDLIKRSECEIILGVEISRDRVTTAMEEAYRSIQQRSSVPGFRKGKAPIDVIKSNFENRCREEVLQRLVPDAVDHAIKKNDLQPVSPAKIKDLSFEMDSPISFKTIIEIRPSFKLGKYKKLKLDDTANAITDKKVDEALNGLLEQRAQLVLSERKEVRDGDFVIIDYEGFEDGNPRKDLAGSNTLVDLGMKEGIPGFKEGIIGSEKGKQKEINVHFPEDYPVQECKGKDIVFRVTVNDIKEKRLPTADDDFAKSMGLKNLDELRGNIEKNLERLESDRVRNDMRRQIIDQLVADHKMALPASLVDQQFELILSEIKNRRIRTGSDTGQDTDNEKLKQEYMPLAERQVKIGFIFDEIARKEDIKVSDDELDRELDNIRKLADSSGVKRKDFDSYLNRQREKIYSRMLDDKIFDLVIQNAKIKKKGDKR